MVKVHVQNFQSIEDAEIDISGFTVITGQNNGGKSALMRAIRGVFQNAKGTSFVRHGTDKAGVTVDFGDHKVHWEKGLKSKPTYILDGGKPMHPGRDVPDEVSSLGVVPVKAGGRDIWPQFAPQFTGQVFLLDQPGSVIAEAVADVDRVSQLSHALRLVDSDRRAAKSELKIRLKDKEQLESDLKKFDGLDDLSDLFDNIEQMSHHLDRIGKALVGVRDLRDRYGEAENETSRLQGVEFIVVPNDKDMNALDRILDVIDDVCRLRDRYQQVSGLVNQLAGVDSINNVDINTDKPSQILIVLQLANQLKSKRDDCVSKIKSFGLQLDDAEKDYQNACLDVDKYLTDIGECPACGSPVR